MIVNIDVAAAEPKFFTSILRDHYKLAMKMIERLPQH
ncbi:MAG: hypothetical protein CM1200mP30_20130 [Pseudomonadota bacterium]|nr:MAG: hypothetical protein CM1200mP30_20130 [Pseudomonadota bacterium]